MGEKNGKKQDKIHNEHIKNFERLLSLVYCHILFDVNVFLDSLLAIVSSADKFCKLLGPRPGPKNCRGCSGSKLFDTDVCPDFFLKNSADDKEKVC